jgi:hypothetical protein
MVGVAWGGPGVGVKFAETVTLTSCQAEFPAASKARATIVDAGGWTFWIANTKGATFFEPTTVPLCSNWTLTTPTLSVASTVTW